MKVIVLNDHLYPDGGADVVALSSAEALADAGIDVTLFVADALREDDRTVRRAKLVCTNQADLMHDPHRVRAALHGLWNVEAARLLKAVLAEHDPAETVVHLHSWTKSLSSSVVRAATSAGFAVICTLHDYFLACPAGSLFDYRQGKICHLKPMSAACVMNNCDSRSYGHKLYRVARQAIQLTAGGLPGGVREFISVSDFSHRVLSPMLPPDSRVHSVSNPIETDLNELVDVTRNRDFVCVARLFKPKGQAVFLEACERAGVQGVCIGEGPDLAELQARFPKARFTGQLTRAEVTIRMRAARALVLPSLWYETQGLVVSEAGALGVPSIVSDCCAALDFVEHDKTGMLFRAGDAADLAAALSRMASDDQLAAKLGRAAAFSYWTQPPTVAAHALALIDVYQKVLDARSERQLHAAATVA
jgi:glycosyltransferase involved in cell wall biosynthesis